MNQRAELRRLIQGVAEANPTDAREQAVEEDVVDLALQAMSICESRAAEGRNRWAIRSELRLWGICEWSWPVAEIEQELRTGAVHVRLTTGVDVARGLPAPPACPSCGERAEMLVRARGGVHCVRCAPA